MKHMNVDTHEHVYVEYGYIIYIYILHMYVISVTHYSILMCKCKMWLLSLFPEMHICSFVFLFFNAFWRQTSFNMEDPILMGMYLNCTCKKQYIFL